MEDKTPDWGSHLRDERLAAEEYVTIWLRNLKNPDRLDAVGSAMGWKNPVMPSDEHPDSFHTDPYVLSAHALLEAAHEYTLDFVEKGLVSIPNAIVLLRGIFALQRHVNMLLHEAFCGEISLS